MDWERETRIKMNIVGISYWLAIFFFIGLVMFVLLK